MKKVVLTITLLMFGFVGAWAQTTDLSLTKTVDNEFPSINTNVTFTLTLTNQSTSTNATNVTVQDLLPAGLTFVSANSAEGSYDSGTGLWSLSSSLAANATATLTITATVIAEGVTTNTSEVASVAEGDIDSTPGNGVYSEDDQASACVSVPVQMCVGQNLDLTVSASEIPAGYTIFKWYKGSIDPANLIAGANTTTLVLTNIQTGDNGDYYFTAEDANGCLHQACCPVRVVVNPLPVGSASNGGPVCEGESISFSSSGGTTYAWAGPGAANMDATNIASPTISNATAADAGIYTVTITNAAGCTATATTQLVVNPLPVATASNNGPYCENGTATFTATGGATYEWDGPGVANMDNAAIANPTIATLTSAAAGTYTVTVTSADGCTQTATTELVVTPLPTASAAFDCGATPSNGSATVTVTATGTNLEYSLDGGAYQPSNIFASVANGLHTIDVREVGTTCVASTTVTPDCNAVQLASLGNYVWYDTNGDGIQDATETGVDGVTVTLYDGNGDVVATTTTDATGAYEFTGLTPGVPYQVGFSNLPSGYELTSANAGGDDTLDSDADAVTGLTQVVTLAPGENNPTLDAGIVAIPASLGNYVWYDVDEDGIQDATETGVDGVTVTLYDGNGNVVATTTTDATGAYEFTGLTPGVPYQVGFSNLPATYVFTTADQGGDDTLDSDANAITGLTQVVTLAPGENNPTLDAGIYVPTVQPASLGNFVWIDTNGDGIQDATEPGVSGVTVTLYDANGNVLATTTTDASGAYSFTNLPPDTYQVGFTLPVGYDFTGTNLGGDDTLDSDADPITGLTQQVTLVAGENNPTLDAGLTPIPASLGNYVWYDTNGDGIQDATETGVDGVTVTLYDGNGNVVATTTTDATGAYEFTGLTPGVPYQVGFSNLPSGYELTSANAGGDDTLDSDADAVTGLTQVVTLAPGENNPTLDAGIVAIPASLGNYVWYDVDEDGIQDATETGVDGVTVTLYDGNGAVVATTTTDATGAYEFTGLTPGVPYQVGFSNLPATYVFTTADQGGDDTLDSDANAITGLTQVVTLAPGENNPTLDAGIYVPTVQPASLGNFVWIDTNGDGIQDATEPGVSGVTVTLYDANGNVLATTTTDASGAYSFTNLPPDTYQVGFTLPVGYDFTGTNLGGDDTLDSDADPITGLTQQVTLVAGENNPTLDAGLTPIPASLGNYVWYDTNGDGIQDATETGVDGVTVTLYDGNGNVVATTTTDATGAYEFTGLTPGVPYQVGFSNLPSGYELTSANAGGDDTLDSDADAVTGLTQVVTLAPGENNPTLDAGIVAIPASLGNYVWYDVDEDGIQDATETGVDGVTVTLYDGNGAVVATTTTDVTGAYEFTGLTPGVPYQVGFSNLPATYVFTTADQGGDDTLDSDANAITGLTQVVTLAPGENNPTLDAGIYVPTVQPASLGNFVWIDTNGDGIQDATEPGVSGVTVTLYDANGNVLATTTTDASGAYSFTNLPPDTYQVGFTLPVGYDFTGTNLGGDDTLDSDADPITGLTQQVTLVAGENNPTLDAGLTPIPASLGNYVWYDTNGDGIQDATETGVDGVTVTLYDGNGNVVATTTTDATGAYEFTGLTPGVPYQVGFSNLPSGYELTSANAGGDDTLDSDADAVTGLTQVVTLAPGENNPTLDAGIVAIPASLGNYVWYDVDEDGIQDATETGVDGVTVTLYDGNGNVVATTTTDATGAYEFTGLTPGVPYQVGFSNLPATYVFTTADQGGDDTLDSDANAITGLTQVVTLAPGENNPTLDAGIYVPTVQPASLGNFVWIDTNGDGIQDATEPGVSGVTVTLYDANGNVLATTTTDASGAYSFTNLPPDTYQVGFTLPVGYDFTGTNLGGDDTLDSDADPITGLTQQVTLVAGENNPTLDAGLTPIPASLGNYVWYDTNGDGIQDATETGVDGVTVTLYDGNGNVVATTTTDATGAYEFTGLTPGVPYQVGFSNLPSGYELTSANAGGDDTLDSDADAVTGLTQVVTLAPGENNPTLDAGIVAIPASLGNYVWYDVDEDGIQDATETGVDGVTVTLYDGNGNVVATTTTDATGAYEFTGLTPGVPYQVGFSNLPATYVFTTADQGGDDTLDSDANAITGLTQVVTLAPGENNPTLDAGIYVPTVQPASLGNFVWIDTNGDGIQDATEPGVSGVTVTLYDANGNVLATTTTDASGAYSFTNLPPDTYQVGFTLPVGYDFTGTNLGGDDTLDSDADPITGLTQQVTLVAGENNPTLDAGLTPIPASLGNYVWYDTNGDGIQDATETGVDGVTVTLYDGNGNVVATTTTDATGAYEFTGLTPGVPYQVGFSNLPSGYELTSANAGGDDTLDSDADAVTGLTQVVTLAPGENNPTLDAGIVAIPASLGNYVWYDVDEDGIQDATETGVDGVTVTLYDGNGNVVATTTTDATGAYEFTGLTPGVPYQVGFSNLPATYVFTTADQGGDDTLDSDANAITGLTPVVILAAGENNPTLDAGIYAPCTLTATNGTASTCVGTSIIIDIATNASATATYAWSNGGTTATTSVNPAVATTYTVTVTEGTCTATATVEVTVNPLPTASVSTMPASCAGNDGMVDLTTTATNYVWSNGATTEDLSNVGAGTYTVTITDGNGCSASVSGTVAAPAGAPVITGTPTTIACAGGTSDLDVTITAENAPYTFEWSNGSTTEDLTGLTAGIYTITVTDNSNCIVTQNFTVTSPTALMASAVGTAPTCTGATLNADGSVDLTVTGGTTPYSFAWSNAATTEDLTALTGGTYTVTVTDNKGCSTTTSVTITDPTCEQPTGSIGDFVWNDTNGDGVQDPGETGIPGIIVTLYDSNGDVIATTTTDQNGNYVFDDLPAGDYTVIVGQGPDGTNPSTPTSIDVTLAPGQDITTVDFGFVPLGSIGDFVWNDTNGDGVQDPGETGIPGITVTLYDSNGDVIATTTTDQNGNYVFDDLPAGDYTVIVGQGPDGTNPSTPTSIDVTLAPGQDITTVDFGFVPLGSIGDFVWNDTNGDGVQDPGETGIPGITVTLYDSNGDVIATTTTDDNGNYVFEGLPAGDYTVIVGQGPDGTTPSTPSSITVTLAPGEDITTVDFGFTPVVPELGSIGDFVWLDTNGDGVQDPGEPGIPSVIVTLYDSNGDVLATTTTDQNGGYIFNDLPAGDYTVIVGSGPDDTTPSTPTSVSVTLGENEDYLDADFGFTPIPTGSIGDFVWNDTDGDGVQDPGETGIPGVTITLYDSNGDVIATTTTDDNGNYVFDNLPAGDYTVVVGSGPDGTNPSTPTSVDVTLTPGQDITTVDFGFAPIPTGSIGDFVWNDLDGDGVQDPSETGIPGVTITLYDSNGDVIATTTTDDNGNYVFEGLPAGDYTVVVGSGPDGTNPSTPTSVDVTLTPGQDITTVDFGFAPLGSIGDFVWNDTDGDGVQDPGETGIPGIIVTLYDDNGNIIGTTTTDQNGNYVFDNLLPGDYTVIVGSGPDGTNPSTPTSVDVTLAPGQDITTVDFGFTPIPTGSIGDFVWNDTDGDGVQDPGETGIPGVTLSLYDSQGNLVATTTTDQNGNYVFDNLPADEYTVIVGQGPDGTTPSTPSSISVTLAPGEDITTVDFGFTPVIPELGSIGDFVWNDTDGDGVQDPGETGIPGIIVTLYDSNGDVIATTTTDQNGNYVFDNLPAGNYTVTVGSGPDGTEPSTPTSLNVTLGEGEDYVNADFGFTPLPTGSIGDFVWFDNDGDGIQDANEPGIPGITVTLYQNGQPIATTTTNANGAYLFDDLQLGNYTVVVGQGPADHNLTTPNQYNVTLTETQPDVLTADFGFVPEPGMIGNFVWLDADADGIQDPSEVGVPGAVIALINSQGDTIYVTTNDFGYYLFDNLPPDEYTVVLISYPDGLTPTTPISITVSLQPGENHLTANFGLTPAVELGSLGNYVWLDMDGDGQQDTNEPGVSGVTVQLYNAVTNTLIGTTTTDASGAYLFTDLPAGSYYVVFTSPNGYLFTYNNQGNDATDSDANTNGQTGTITLAEGEDNLTVDAGLVLPASLGDFVWQDLDADNQYDLGEPVLPNVTVQLFDSNGQLIGTTTTDAQGIYGFSNLLPGTYTVVVPQLVNGLVAENGISITTNLSSGETDLTLDFPYVVPGVIGDFVWLDLDSDGNQDQGEPGIEGITVILYLNGTQIATTTTNANGTYLFENLAPGNYTVSLANIPDGLGYTTPQTVSHTLLQGEVFLNADFGLIDNGLPQGDPVDVCTPIFTATQLCVDLPNGYEITDYQSVFDCNISNVTQSCITYTPFPGFTGTDTVTITFCEIGNPNNCLEQVFYVHIGCIAPQANQDEAFIHTNSVVINGQTTNTTTGYQGINIDVLANDYSCYVLNNPTIVIPPMHGTATVNPATGEIVYVPNPGFSGVDTLTYQTCNNDATCNLCDETIVIIHVDPQPEDCETFETSICVEPLQPETVCPEFCIDGSWHITSATAGYFTGCVIQVVDDCVTYTALPLQTGNDTITVIACSDANPAICDTAYIYVHIGNCTPPPPVCETWTTTFCTAPYVTNTICPVFCPAGNYTITSVTNLDGISCNITINNGCVQYQGFPTNVDINDVLTIIGCANGVCDTAYAYITVSNNCNGTPNQAPVAVDDSGTSTNGNPVTINVLGNDYDPDGDPLTVTVTQQPANGTLTVNGGNITYTPNPGFNGTDTYNYQICDDATPPLCDQATVTITVTGNSTPPVAVDDSGTSDGGLPVTINVISNDYDLDGDAISVTSYTQPANGTITVNGSQFTYTPNAGFNGTDSFMYQICDNDGNCDMATVTITVINNACEDTFILCGQPMTPVQITPSFCGAGPWTITSATTTFNCSIQIIDNTTVQYTALPLFVGSETITIVGCTPLGVCDTLYYVIDVTDDCQESGRIYVQDENNAQHIAEVLAQDKEVRLTNATATQLSLNNVYPVPATNFVNVAFVSPSNATATLTITDLTGRVMTTNRVDAQQGSNTVNINLNGYTAGMYMVTISTENATATTRFIKQ